jgi:hypothetical protein
MEVFISASAQTSLLASSNESLNAGQKALAIPVCGLISGSEDVEHALVNKIVKRTKIIFTPLAIPKCIPCPFPVRLTT